MKKWILSGCMNSLNKINFDGYGCQKAGCYGNKQQSV